MNRNVCPDPEILADYSVGRLAAAARKGVEDHLEDCASCQAALELVPVQSDSLVEVLAQPSEPESFLEESSYWLGLEKVRRLGKQLLVGRGDAAKSARTELTESSRIGSYQLIKQIGEGGMGTVWLAEQTEPVKRSVALKLIKPGMDSREVITRFEAERQALALMDHPNIAKILDAGLTEGRQGDKETRRQGDKESKLWQTTPNSLSPCLQVSLSPCLQ